MPVWDVQFSPEAIEELQTIITYYDSLRAGLGIEFMIEFEKANSTNISEPIYKGNKIPGRKICSYRPVPICDPLCDKGKQAGNSGANRSFNLQRSPRTLERTISPRSTKMSLATFEVTLHNSYLILHNS